MERQEGTRAIYIEFNARFTSAQFHRRPTTVLKGVLNRRVVKESHRDAAYKGIPPTLSPALFFFFFSFLINVRRIDLSRLSIFFSSDSSRLFAERIIGFFFFFRVIYILISLHQSDVIYTFCPPIPSRKHSQTASQKFAIPSNAYRAKL